MINKYIVFNYKNKNKNKNRNKSLIKHGRCISYDHKDDIYTISIGLALYPAKKEDIIDAFKTEEEIMIRYPHLFI